MPDKKSLSRLTRSLAVGTSVGAVVLQVGCAPVPSSGPVTVTGSGGAALSVSSQAEAQACLEAIRSRSLSSVVSLMRDYPSSSCIPFIANTVAPSTLAAVPPSVIAGLDPSIRAQLPQGLARRGAQPSEAATSASVAQAILNPENNPGTSRY